MKKKSPKPRGTKVSSKSDVAAKGVGGRPGGLWGGRFRTPPGPELRALGDSLAVDGRLLPQDLRASVAHARMLGRTGILPRAEANRIVRGLEAMRRDLSAGRLSTDGATDEDVHSFVERVLGERIGASAGRLHTARSRNDQVATDLRLWLLEEGTNLRAELRLFAGALAGAARAVGSIIVPAYTHLQRGQPVLLAHTLLAHAEPLLRDDGRVEDALARAAFCPLGSGAATGVPFPIDREGVARELGFRGPTPHSMDAVSDRDFAVEFLAAASLGLVHLSRFAEDVVLWTTSEFAFARLGDDVSTGSSIMPQKRNPDTAELVRGKTGRVIGDLMALLTTLKGLPLTYNRDLQEDKEALFDGVDTWRLCLRASAALASSLHFDAGACARSLEGGFLEATEVADFLVEQGVPFRTAHELAGRAVLRAEELGQKTLRALPPEEWERLHPLLGPEVLPRLKPSSSVNRRNHPGGTSPNSVQRNLLRIEAFTHSPTQVSAKHKPLY